MLEVILGPLVVGLLAAAVISVVNRNILPRFGTWTRKSFDFVNVRLPRMLRPLEQTLLCIGAAVSTCFILAHPEVPPWSVLTSLGRLQDVNALSMLAAAAALLASLCFAATFLRAAEKDAGGGELYLGFRLSTFLIARSRATTMLGIPAFQMMTLMLFVIPLVQGFLPKIWDPTAVDSIPTLAPKLVAIAIWCACFGIVGIVLILNVLGLLRSSTVGLLQPEWLKAMVRAEVRRVAADDFEWILKQPDVRQNRIVREWVQVYLKVAVSQPPDLFSTYYGLTIAPYRFASWNERSVARYI